MEFIMGPDVYVNASVALGSPPEQVTRRTLGGSDRPAASEWILERIEAMFRAIPSFKAESIGPQMDVIRGLVDIVDETKFEADEWEKALVSVAKAAGLTRVVTDHPDLVEIDESDGIEFITTENWLVEQTTPPPLPG